MIRRLVHSDGRVRLLKVEDEEISVATTRDGTTETETINAWDSHGKPAQYALDEVLAAQLSDGWERTELVDVHLLVEDGSGCKLPSKVRAFFADGAYRDYQGKLCDKLSCSVDFVADCVLGDYDQVHWSADQNAEVTFQPISACVVDGQVDEQQWIGVNPEEPDGPVYGLYTSGEYEVVFADFSSFLASLT